MNGLKAWRNSLLVVVATLLLAALLRASAVESYLDNGVVKVGIDLDKGGSITYLSKSGTNENVVNNYDLGRQIQQSYYSGPQPYNPSNNASPNWPNWPWNPIQTGDCFGHPSLVLAHTNTGRLLYVKCRPMQWALHNVPGECTFESWITLHGGVVTVSNRLINLRTDTAEQFAARDQELPAVYTIDRKQGTRQGKGNKYRTGRIQLLFQELSQGLSALQQDIRRVFPLEIGPGLVGT